MNKQERPLSEKIVLDRYNSFLVATAFLIAAFTAVAIRYTESCSLLLLANAVNAVGLYLAIYFTVANYHGALCTNADLGKENKYVIGRNSPHILLLGLLKYLLISFPIKPLSQKIPVVHTWLIPFLFCLFWWVTWFVVLPDWWVPTAFGIGVPLLYLFTLGIISKFWGQAE